MNSMLQMTCGSYFSPLKMKIPRMHFFFLFKAKSNYQAFQDLVNTHSKGPSAVFGVSWQSYKLRTWHYSGQLKKKEGKTKIFCYFIRKHRQKLTGICQQQWQELARTKKISRMSPKFPDVKFCQRGENTTTNKKNISFCSLTIRKAKVYEGL